MKLRTKFSGGRVPEHSNLRGGVSAVRLRYTFTVVEAGVKLSHFAPFTAGIKEMQALPPVDPVAASIGQGGVIFKWGKPDCDVRFYNIYSSLLLDSGYELLAGRIASVSTIVRNLPVGSDVYFRVTTINSLGMESEFSQVKAGMIAKPLVIMRVRMLSGSLIPNAAVFGAVDPNTGTVSTFSAVGDIMVSGSIG